MYMVTSQITKRKASQETGDGSLSPKTKMPTCAAVSNFAVLLWRLSVYVSSIISYSHASII